MFAPTSVSPVFISYRRADARHAAARLRDSLTDLEHRVWFDIDDIPSAMPYRAQIATALRQCDVALVVIGPQWLTVCDAEGHRRLDDPDDDVRLEIAQALARTDVTLVPVLVDNAEMPPRGELPPDLQPLCDLNAARLSHESWRYQVQALHATIEMAARRGWSAWGEALGVALLAAIPAALLYAALPGTRNQSDPDFAASNLSKLGAQRVALFALIMGAVFAWVAWRRPGHRWGAGLMAGLLWGGAFALLGAVVHGVPTYWLGDELPDTPRVALSDGTDQALAGPLVFAAGFAVTGAGLGALVGAAWNPPGLGRGLVSGALAAGVLAFGVRWVNGAQTPFAAEALGAALIAVGAVAAAVAAQWLTRVTRARAVRA